MVLHKQRLKQQQKYFNLIKSINLNMDKKKEYIDHIAQKGRKLCFIVGENNIKF